MQIYSVRQSSNIGQEILDADGKTVAWTTDFWLAQVMSKLLTDANVSGVLTQMTRKEG